MRRGLVILVLVALAGAAFWATYSFMRGPYWALYQVGKGIHDRDARLALAYIDLDAIARSQKEELIKMYLGDRPAEQQRQISGIVSAFMGPITGHIRDRLARWVADPKRDNIPSSWTLVAAARVQRNGDVALVVLSEPEKGRRLRMGMRKDPTLGYWRVVDVSTQDLKKIIEQELVKQGKSD